MCVFNPGRLYLLLIELFAVPEESTVMGACTFPYLKKF